MKKRALTKNLNGFSLVEILVSIGILTFIAMAVFNVMLVGQRTFFAGTGTLDMQSEARKVFFWITKELREAQSHTITVVNANDDSIVFSTPTKISVNYYRDINDANGDTKTDQIIREYPAGTRKIVANSASSLKFVESGNSIEVRLALSHASGGRTLTSSPRTKVEVRNE